MEKYTQAEHQGERDIVREFGMKIRVNISVLLKDYESTALKIWESLEVEGNNMTSGME